MLPGLLALEIVALLAVIALLLRRPRTAKDPRSERLLEADIVGTMARQDARAEALERYMREEMASFRRESADADARGHESRNRDGEALRRELKETLGAVGETLRMGLEGFRGDHKTDTEHLRTVLDSQFRGISSCLTDFTTVTHQRQLASGDVLHSRLEDLGKTQGEHQERMRSTVEARLDKLNEANTAKLEEMRQTVDEKLHATLQTRLTESFGQVTDQLAKVHSGLGEMSKLSAGVDDLQRIFTNVKARGGFAEVQLGTLLAQTLAPSQFAQNVKVKANTAESVEFCVKLPTPTGEALLPIDAKFPREAWERLESAYECGTAVEIASAGRAFEAAIRTEGKRICEKYIAPPSTTSFAIMFLPTEGLYAEVMRRDGLQAEIQARCHVTLAGPSTLSAILNSFQMGFHMLQLQQKGDEVWKVLASARTQFGKFEGLMTKMDDQVCKIQKTIQEVGTRTRVINRTLRDVSLDDELPELAIASTREEPLAFPGLLPKLAAVGDEERTGS